jgi:4-amino-4-deoxy-L-arabinose transferase-like glycosyltransferase
MDRRARWALIVLVGLAFALRAPGLDFQSLWRDEVDAIRFARAPWTDLLAMFHQPGQNGPLYFLLLRYWLALAGDSAFALRFLSTTAGVLAVPMAWRVGSRLFRTMPAIGLIAACLAAVSPYMVWYSQEGKMYALTVLLALLSMDLYLQALDEGGWQRWAAYVIVASGLLYIHLVAALMIAVQAAILIVQLRRLPIRRRGEGLAAMAALTLPYLPLLVWQLPELTRGVETGYRFVPLHDMLYSLLVNYSLGVMPLGTEWSLLPFVALLLAVGLGWRQRNGDMRGVGIVVLWLVLPILLFFLVTLVRPMYTARYLIFVTPAYWFLLAYGLVQLGRRSQVLGGVLGISLLVISGWGMAQQARVPMKADFRSATPYVAERLHPSDLVLFQIPYGRYSFDYYYKPVIQPPAERSGGFVVWLPRVIGGGGVPYRWAEGLYTNGGMAPEEVARRMERMVEGSSAVWLVATEAELWDERGLVVDWLETNWTAVERVEFVRVQVVRYENSHDE